METSDVIVEEKFRKIIEESAKASFGPLIEKEPGFLEAPLFKRFTKNLITNICGSFRKAYVISVLAIIFLFFGLAEAQVSVTLTDFTGKQTQNQLTSMRYDGKTMTLQFVIPIAILQPPLTVTINGEAVNGSITFSESIMSSTISCPISAVSPRSRRRRSGVVE